MACGVRATREECGGESSGLSWCSGWSSRLPGCWLPDSAAPATRVRMWGPEMPHRQSTTAQRPPMKRSAGDLKSTCGPLAWNACDFRSCIIKLQRDGLEPAVQRPKHHQLARPAPSTFPVRQLPLAAIPEPSPLTTMSEKRPASDDPNERQLVVKRQNVGTSRALTRPGASGSGALIQTVCSIALGFSACSRTWRVSDCVT